MNKEANIFFYLLIISFSFFACKSTMEGKAKKEESAEQTSHYKTIAQEKLGEGVEYKKSPLGSYVLCLTKGKPSVQFPQNSIQYLVFDLKKGTIVYEGATDNGHVSWFSDYQLQQYNIPGMMPQGRTKDDYTQVYNLKTKKKSSKSELLKGN